MPSYEFVRDWFKKAANNAKRLGKNDSAALWEDGLSHLENMKKELDETGAKMLQYANQLNAIKRILINENLKSQKSKTTRQPSCSRI